MAEWGKALAEWAIRSLLWYEMAYKDHVILQAMVSSVDSSHPEQLHIFLPPSHACIESSS